MDDKLKKEAFKFLFKEFERSIWWHEIALTREGNPEGNPPDLNLNQAKSIFQELSDKGLVIPHVNEQHKRCWLIHQGKRKEWNELINPPGFIKRNWKKALLGLGIFILWSSSIAYTKFIQNSVTDHQDKIYETLKEQIRSQEKTPDTEETKSSTKEN